MSFPNDITIHDTSNKDKYSFAVQNEFYLNLTLPKDYTQNPDDPLTLKYTKWYGGGIVYTTTPVQNGAPNLYQFHLKFKADDVQTSDLYGSIKQVVTGPTQKLVNTESHYQVYIPNDCTCINGVKSNPSYDGYEVVPPTGLTLNSDIVKTIYADVNGDNSKRVQGTLDGNNIKFEFNRTDWGALNFSRVRDTKGNLIINLQDYVKQLTNSGKTSTDLEHVNPTLKANNVTVSITGNTVNLTANDGYLIDSATLDIGNSLFGDDTPLKFTISPDKKTASVTITDESLIDPQQEYSLSVKTSVEQKLTVQYQYNSSLVSVTTTTSDYQINTPFTLNATPSTGYTYDKVDNIFSVSPSDNVTINQTGTNATITLPEKQSYTITLKDPTKLPTQKEVNYTQTGYTIYIPTDCTSIDGTGSSSKQDGYQLVPPTNLTLNDNAVSTIYADVNGDNSNRVQGTLKDNKIVFAFSDSQWSPLSNSHIRDSNGNLIYNLQDYINQLKPKFTGTITSKIKDVTATINNMTGVITVTVPDNSTLTGTINVLDSTGKTITTIEIKNNSATVPTQYTSNNFELVGSLVYSTNYKVDISQIKDFVDYTTNQLTITLTAKENELINSLHAVADLSWSGESYALKDDTISIGTDKKTATITVPNEYNSKLGYTIVITGDFSKLTPPPVNPSGTNSIHVYQLDDDTLTKFSTKAMGYFQGGTNTVYDFQKFITQLYKLPFNIPENESTGTTNISTGWFTVNEPARKLNKTRYVLDLGTINVINVNNNGFDHNIKSCTLYLPFVSPLSVSYETILNHSLNVQYDTDLLTGKTTVNVFVDKELLNSFQTNINENLDLYNIYNDSINGTLSSILENTLDHCFIKVEYYQPINNLVSYETNEHGTLKDYHGYIQTKNTIVSCGTHEEQIAIMQLLEQGVIIK